MSKDPPKDTHDETGDMQGGNTGEVGGPPRKLRIVTGKRRSAKKAPPRKKKYEGFTKGNQQWKRGYAQNHPKDPIDFLDKVVTDALNRVRQREYIVEEVNGQITRRVRPLDAAKANAVGNLARVKMEINEQRQAGEEVRALKQQLAEMGAVLNEVVQGKAG